MAGLICGGWDPYDGGQVYEIPLGGTIMKQKFALGGSGSTYIYGLVDATYRENMSKEECKIFVKNGKYYTILFIKYIIHIINSNFYFINIKNSYSSCNGKRWIIWWCYSSCYY